MGKKEDYESKTEALLQPIVKSNGFELIDVEYVKEGSSYYLRAYIDKPGGIAIDDCELVSRELSDMLDKVDYIDEAYILEVSSPGLLRPIKKDKDFKRSLGKEVEIHLFKAQDKKKEFIGILSDYDSETVTIKTEEGEKSFVRKEISSIKPYVVFD